MVCQCLNQSKWLLLMHFIFESCIMIYFFSALGILLVALQYWFVLTRPLLLLTENSAMNQYLWHKTLVSYDLAGSHYAIGSSEVQLGGLAYATSLFLAAFLCGPACFVAGCVRYCETFCFVTDLVCSWL